MINKGESPNLRHITKTHTVDWDWLFERVNWDHSLCWLNTSEQAFSWRIFLTKEVFTTIQRNSLWTLWQIKRPFASHDVRSCSRKPFSCSVFRKPQAMSQVRIQVLKSGCALDGHLTLEQLSNHEFICTQDKRDLLAGMLFVQTAEGNLLQVDTSSQILTKQGVCGTISPFDGELSKMHDAEGHVFSDSVLCMGKGAMNEPEVKFTKKWNEYLEQYRESARRTDGEKIQFVFFIFPAKTNEIMREIGGWIRRGQG